MGRNYHPPYFDLQCTHHESDTDPWADIPEYQDFSRMFANLRKLRDPAALGPFMDADLVGSPATICRRIDRLTALGSTISWFRRLPPGRRSSSASA